MKDVIVNSLEFISKVAIILMITIPFLGGLLTGHLIYGLLGAISAFVAGVVIFGGLFVLLEINDNLRALRKHFEQAAAVEAAKPKADL